MNYREEALDGFEYYRGNDLSGGGVENPVKVHESTDTQRRSAIEGNKNEEDAVNKERETELELWMENVKAFIRQIDVSSL